MTGARDVTSSALKEYVMCDKLLWQWLWWSLNMETSKQSHLWMHREIRSPAVTQYPPRKASHKWKTNGGLSISTSDLRCATAYHHASVFISNSFCGIFQSFYINFNHCFDDSHLEPPYNLSQGGHNHDRRSAHHARGSACGWWIHLLSGHLIDWFLPKYITHAASCVNHRKPLHQSIWYFT